MSPPISVARQGRSATVTIDRPPLNILDLDTIDRLGEALTGLADDSDLALLFLRGAGDRAFSAGVSVQDHTPDRMERMLAGLHGAVRRLRDLPAISIAAVNGYCLGGGMELALACDLVLAADDARFGQPEIDLGCFPPVAAALYPRRLGEPRALELLLTGRVLACDEAERLGLVTWRVPAGGLDLGIARVESDLGGKSAAVLRLAKRAVRTGAERDFPEALVETERLYLEELAKLGDMREGLDAFLEKRTPVWKHR